MKYVLDDILVMFIRYLCWGPSVTQVGVVMVTKGFLTHHVFPFGPTYAHCNVFQFCISAVLHLTTYKTWFGFAAS